MLPISHSNSCPNRTFETNCKKAEVQIQYSQNLQKCAVCMAIIDSEGKILLSRRPSYMRKFPNAWVMPGGHIDPHESMEESVRREVLEETGIEIQETDKIEPFFLFESVSMKAYKTVAPSSGHLIIFYKV